MSTALQILDDKEQNYLIEGTKFLAISKTTQSICNDEELSIVEKHVKFAQQYIKNAKEFLENDIKEANKRHKELTGKLKSIIAPFEQGLAIENKLLQNYRREKIRKETEEAENRAKEAQKQIDEARLSIAVEMEKEGNLSAANAILEQPVIAPIVMPIIAKSSIGMNYKLGNSWKAIIKDPLLLLTAIILDPNKHYLLNLSPNMFYKSELNKFATSLKVENPLPGVFAEQDFGTISR